MSTKMVRHAELNVGPDILLPRHDLRHPIASPLPSHRCLCALPAPLSFASTMVMCQRLQAAVPQFRLPALAIGNQSSCIEYPTGRGTISAAKMGSECDAAAIMCSVCSCCCWLPQSAALLQCVGRRCRMPSHDALLRLLPRGASMRSRCAAAGSAIGARWVAPPQPMRVALAASLHLHAAQMPCSMQNRINAIAYCQCALPSASTTQCS